jgi:hypothetical protein
MPQYRPCSEVVSTEIDEDESVLLSLKTQQYYSVNETGKRIWELLSSGHDSEAIAATITEEWAISQTDALKRVNSFLEELHEEGLVDVVEED